MGRAIALLSKRDLIQLAFVGDRPVAFSMCMPEIHESWAHARGSLTPMGTLRALAAWRHTRTAAFKLIGVVPDLRGSGVHARMVVAVVEGAQRAGFTRMDGSVIDERNGPMRGVVEGAGMQVYRRYRLFERAL
jgi:GNAT superfamily N-acetyltransferase